MTSHSPKRLYALLAIVILALPIASMAETSSLCIRKRLNWELLQGEDSPTRWAEDSWRRLRANLSPDGTPKGTVIASPSHIYYFDWTRDSALAQDILMGKMRRTTDPREKELLRDELAAYAKLSREKQLSGGPKTHGEPKFMPDGSIYPGEWARPQNDGPALRAITLMKYGNYLRDSRELDKIGIRLYDPQDFTAGIKGDLEYVAHHWRDRTWDVWEETYGDHFYTRMVEYKAMREGAKYADTMGDPGAAAFYRKQEQELKTEILKHWDPGKKAIVATLNGRQKNKTSNLDSAVVLAFLHTYEKEGGIFSAMDDRMLSTVNQLENAFKKEYPLNERYDKAVAIGRYVEDHYDGHRLNSKGNPWVLTTNGFAEFYYRAAREVADRKALRINATNAEFYQKLVQGTPFSVAVREGQVITDPGMIAKLQQLFREKGDEFLEITRNHLRDDGTSAEQFNRESGYMQGADELTWNYASRLKALWARGVKF